MVKKCKYAVSDITLFSALDTRIVSLSQIRATPRNTLTTQLFALTAPDAQRVHRVLSLGVPSSVASSFYHLISKKPTLGLRARYFEASYGL